MGIINVLWKYAHIYRHGDLLFASSAKKDEETVEQSQPQIQQTSNIPARPWQLARDHAIDQYWSKQSGRIPRPTSSSKEGNLNTLPIEVSGVFYVLLSLFLTKYSHTTRNTRLEITSNIYHSMHIYASSKIIIRQHLQLLNYHLWKN